MARRAFSKEALGGLAFASPPQAENVLALPKRGRVTKPQPPKRPRPKVAPRPKPIVELDSRLAKVSAKMRVHKAVPIHLTVDDYREVVAFCEARELRLTAALQ